MQKINQSTLNFLVDLEANNTRDWFNANRDRYDIARNNFIDFTNALIGAITVFDNSIGSLDAKDCIFRIFRDVRFSPNKQPYKTNMGCYIANGGRKSSFAGYYFHIEPNASFVSGGIYMAQPNILQKIRSEIETYPEKFKEIVEHPKFKETFPSLGNESLKRVPKGFSSQSAVAEYLKLKHITPHHMLDNSNLLSNTLLDDVALVFEQINPLISFLNEAIEQN